MIFMLLGDTYSIEHLYTKFLKNEYYITMFNYSCPAINMTCDGEYVFALSSLCTVTGDHMWVCT